MKSSLDKACEKRSVIFAALLLLIIASFQNCTNRMNPGSLSNYSAATIPTTSPTPATLSSPTPSPTPASSPCTYPGPWKVVDTYSFTKSAYGSAVTSDKLKNLYSVGTGFDSSNTEHWIVRKSSDGGTTWTTSDDFQVTPGQSTNAIGATSDNSGIVYVVGFAHNGTNLPTHYLVRRSFDQGATWATVDDFNYTPGSLLTGNYAFGIGTDVNGNIYSVGGVGDGNNIQHFLTRKSSDQGVTWKTVDDYVVPGSQGNIAFGVGSDSLGNIFTYGYANFNVVNVGTQFWIVRKSANSGATWSTVDSFGSGTQATSFVADTSGNLFVSGSSPNLGETAYVRKSVDQGVTWSTVDTAVGARSSLLNLDSLGNIYATLLTSPNSVIRKSSDHGVTWATSATLALTSLGMFTGGNSSIDPIGNLFVTGSAASGYTTEELSCH